MDPVLFFAVLGVFYGVALFFDMFFKSCMHYPYEAFLLNTGLQVKFLRLKWHTTALNRTILRWGSSCNRIWTQSFNIGVIITTFIILPISLGILLLTLFSDNDNNNTKIITSSYNDVDKKFTQTKIQILLPGINLPLEEIGFYIITLIICSIVHEFGHALAAILEDVPVTGFGIQLYFCIPFAYTELSLEHLNNLKGIRKLRILCAGIWNNIILTIICLLLLLTLNILSQPFYKLNKSIIITEINKKSPLLGERGLYINDEIIKINNCNVNNIDTWYDCLLNTIKYKPKFCVTSDFIRLNDESGPIKHDSINGIIQCCNDYNNIKLSCFEYLINNDYDDIDTHNNQPIMEIPQYICLDIRKTIENSLDFCTKTNHCNKGFCIKPLLNNLTTIITLKRYNNDNDLLYSNNYVIYIGHPVHISKTIKISQFVPKTKIFTSNLADTILLFLKYNIVFSLGLAIVNAIPCFGLDGYHIINTLINNYLITKITIDRGKRDLLVLFICFLGSLLFLCSILKIFWISIINKII